MTTNFKPSLTPVTDIAKITKPGQPYKMRQYRPGYERYLSRMTRIAEGDPDMGLLTLHNRNVIQELSAKLKEAAWVREPIADQTFERNIVALEAPKMRGGKLKEGVELVVAKWGTGFTSPVHGHATGYMHEEILYGKMRVNTYRMVEPESNVVRPVKTEIVGPGTFVSQYAPDRPWNYFKRQTLIHNFVALEDSASLHYLPEHTRDGRDNGFKVEFFDDRFKLQKSDVTRITSYEGMYLRKGDVVLVRSSNVPEYGDHYIVVTGAPVMKEHGLRVRDEAIQAPTQSLLDQYEMNTGLILLKLKSGANEAFLEFHGIEIVNGEVVFPTA